MNYSFRTIATGSTMRVLSFSNRVLCMADQRRLRLHNFLEMGAATFGKSGYDVAEPKAFTLYQFFM